MSGETRTLCPYCGVGCGLVVGTDAGRLTRVSGDPIYPVNRGRTCRKPLELPAAVHARDRAKVPLLRDQRDVRFRETGWVQAMGRIANRVRAITAEHGPDSIAFYISGQLLTEDYYAVNKLAKGFLHTNNVDSNSRLCMSSAVAGYTAAFGSDGPPPAYADLELADCFLLLGTNTATCHPIVWARIRDRSAEGAFVICADPRRTQTAVGSDLHLPVRPGTDLALLNAMLHVIDRDGLADEDFLSRRTTGWEAARAVALQWSPARAADACGVPAADIEYAARRFASGSRSMALWSMGANQSTVGTLKNRALINLCLATGQIGRPGAGPLSLTGQPNAMGGRETGGLAHLLPGYRRIDSPEDRAEMERFWRLPADSLGISPRAGLPAVDLFDALHEGSVRAVWIVATNPVVSMPDSGRVRAALERAELVVVQDAYHPTETSALAHAVLPAAAWPEKEGTMTNSERRVGLARRALDPPGEALPDWRIFARLAAELGHGEHFAWGDSSEVFDEFVACTAGRVCDMAGLSHERLLREGSVQWPCPAGSAGGRERYEQAGRRALRRSLRDPPEAVRLYTNHRFRTPDGRARLAPTPHADTAETPDGDFPLLLTSGRVAEHWHTMTRTGKSEALLASVGAPFVEVHPEDAEAAGLKDGERARVVSRRGRVELLVKLDSSLPAGVAFAPFHWGALHAPAGAGQLNGTTLGATDPVSHQPELKAAAVRIEPLRIRSPIFDRPHLPACRTGPPPRRARRHVVVVGTGMAALETVEEVLRRRPEGEWSVTMLGEEPGTVYNRILLSKVLARTVGLGAIELRPPAWYSQHGVILRSGLPVVAVDSEHRTVTDGGGDVHPYDALVLATGSRPFVPPIPGADSPHVHAFRTRADVAGIDAALADARRAVVIGGGLLGLEAAAGLSAHGVAVRVVEVGSRLMPQQLDEAAAALLERALARLGIETATGATVEEIGGCSVTLKGGEQLSADLVVLAAGVRPECSLARAAGIETARGILVDDEMRTSAPSVWAVGECAEHRGTVHGLWAPLAEQARVAGASVCGDPAAFHGWVPATTLKVAGVELFAGGTQAATHGQDEIIWSDSRRGSYRKLVLDRERLVGAMLLGDATAGRELSTLLRSGAPVPEHVVLAPGASGRATALEPCAEETVCSCNNVTRGEIQTAIGAGGLLTLAQVSQATRAATGCGSCAGEVEKLLRESDLALPARDSSSRNTDVTVAKQAAATIEA